MKKQTFLLFLLIGIKGISQVGVNTVTPLATLDVVAKTTDGSRAEGIAAPRLTGDQVKAGDLQYGTSQKGVIVYCTSAVGVASPKTANITREGYYYFDGAIWQKIINGNDSSSAPATNIYTNNGTLTGNRIVTQNSNTLAFTGTAQNAFSVAENTFSVDAATSRIGLGTITPLGRLHLYNNTLGTDNGNDYLFDDESSINRIQSMLMRRSNAGDNLSLNNLIGSYLFVPKINGGFSYFGSGISGIYRGDGTNDKTALAFLINKNNEAARIDENGFLGIGTTAPSVKLDVQGSQLLNAVITGATTKNALDINIGLDNYGYGNRLDNYGINMKTSSSSLGGNIARINFGDISTAANGNNGSRYLSFSVGRTPNELMYLTDANSGRVGIGTLTPVAKLDVQGTVSVNGASTNASSYVAGTSTNIDFSKSNLAYSNLNPGSNFTLQNVKDGGTYTLLVQGTTSGTASFSASGFTVKSMNNGPTTAGKQTLYTFIVIGTNVYASMATGF
jgi:hypothetical protein